MLTAIQKGETKMINGLFERYEKGELPAIHCSDNPIKNAFLDALKIQADRIVNNLKNHFTNMTEEQIKDICFSDVREVDNEV
jgi:hypothetical protein